MASTQGLIVPDPGLRLTDALYLFNLIVGFQRIITKTPSSINPTDQVVISAISSPATLLLPAADLRLGLLLTIKDAGFATANNITILPNGTDLIDGQPSVTMSLNYQSISLIPENIQGQLGWLIMCQNPAILG